MGNRAFVFRTAAALGWVMATAHGQPAWGIVIAGLCLLLQTMIGISGGTDG